MTYAEKFVCDLLNVFGTVRVIIYESEYYKYGGMPVAVAWDSFGEVELIKFCDGSTFDGWQAL
jgi:hypothetical protein